MTKEFNQLEKLNQLLSEQSLIKKEILTLEESQPIFRYK